MSTPPPVPPVADADRYVSYSLASVSTSYVDVPFPVYGDQSDLRVVVDGDDLNTAYWALVSASGAPLNTLSQPLTDGRVAFSPAISADTVEIYGEIHPRQTVMPTAPGIGRREFNQTVGYVLSSLREFWTTLGRYRAQPFGFDASGPLSERAQWGDKSKGFRFAQLDDASGRPLLFVKLSDTLDDWSQAINFRGPAGVNATGGTVTSVATGFGLKGGAVTTTGTLALDPTQFAMGFQNRLFNGGMEIDQRNAGAAATLATASGVTNYTVDRWYGYISTSASGFSAQRVSVKTGGVNYALRVKRVSTTTATPTVYLAQPLETDANIDLQGKTVTLFFRARKGADFSGGTLGYSVVGGKGTNQSAASLAASTWTNQTVISTGTVTLGTDFAVFSAQAAIGADITQLAVSFSFSPSGTAGANDYYDITDVELRPGAWATADYAPERRPTPVELSLCQRFFSKSYPQGTVPGATRTGGSGAVTVGNLGGCTGENSPIIFPMTMRSAPTVTVYDNAGTSAKTSYKYSGSWTDNVAATVAVNSDRSAVVTATEVAYYYSFDWSATAEL
jgi:hypothetical protein